MSGVRFPKHWVAVGAKLVIYNRGDLHVRRWKFEPLNSHYEVSKWFAIRREKNRTIRVYMDVDSLHAAMAGPDGCDPLFVEAAEALIKYVKILK